MDHTSRLPNAPAEYDAKYFNEFNRILAVIFHKIDAARHELDMLATSPHTNATMSFIAKGTGSVELKNGQGTGFSASAADATSVNYLSAFAKATGSPPQLAAVGTDANIDVAVVPKGTGTLRAGTTGMFAANAAVATGLTNVGPVGSRTTVQKWLVINDVAGNPFYIPCF